ncbi:hypothetical protein [Bacillus sp. FJAT-42315]|uniref:hypothetical protein n=1 Tax=Bacillus sp. FJAT-42315 TaxID=2014077 RepID=UPI0012FEB4AF|nr:hypothetical protein [Bacillus sp. FJAT-42315]
MNYNGIFFVCLVTFYFPLFVWLSFSYIKFADDGSGHSKRKSVYLGFLLSISVFHFINRWLLNMRDSYGLMIIASIILVFSVYMLLVIMRDRRREAI